MPGTTYHIEINPKVPQRLARIEELANNLWYSWDRPTRGLFSRLHPALWHAVGHSPKAFLKRVDQRRLEEAADDPVFLGTYYRVLSEYDTYHNEPARNNIAGLAPDDLIAYFCAEFGFHESLPIYSGGLGILAGDHCKAASDMRLPFVGVGLLYRQGYFHQTIDGQGNQKAIYTDSDFDDLPITPVTRDGGGELRVPVALPGRTVQVKVWQARAGHVMLYLLDTDLEDNSAHDRGIGHRLYGGDRTTRIEQEIVLGIGGVRALRELGLKPTVWHINEGHAAFLVLERIRALTQEGLDFAAALEAVAAATVFTTHTSVPAGHDYFSAEMMRQYFAACCKDLRIGANELLRLGQASETSEFNMTALAVHGSRFQNGVSRIHGRVSSHICAPLWPQIEPEENPIGHVTNAVHAPTFLATDWNDLFDRYLGHGWSQRLTDPACWSHVFSIPDHLFWSVRQSLKSQMLYLVRHRVTEQNVRIHGSEAHVDRLLRFADPSNPNVLTIGFARRFATYKRATLLFHDLKRLREIMCNSERPVVLIMAGKAHPADQPGTDLIRRIAEIARLPDLEGHVLLVEGYDLQLARRLVSGVDVWLNNPIYPMEASGTSGMKGAMNGVINLSVLDGWWAEGYDGKNGWAIKPATSAPDDERRNLEEARALYELLEDNVVPLYYNRGPTGHSPGWVAMAKRSLTSVLPRFNSTRMLSDYLTQYYVPAANQGRRYQKEACSGAREIAAWKAKVRAAWDKVTVRRHDQAARRIRFGESVKIEVAVNLNGLAPSDIAVELLLGRPGQGEEDGTRSYFLDHVGLLAQGPEHLFTLALTPQLCGKLDYRIRAYPHHELLTHRFEMGMMRWL
jgi:starch phosphorylase